MSTVPSSATTSAVNPAIESLLNFVKHPGTNTGAGLALTAISAFTSAVPASDRSSTTILGIAYAFATLVVDWLTKATTSTAK